MNLQSGKFCTLERGKLLTQACAHVLARQLGEALNSLPVDFSELRIKYVSNLKIGKSNWGPVGFSLTQVGDWSRRKFSVLKIETVENGSIRQ